MRSRTLREDRQKPVRSITHGAIHPLSRKSKGVKSNENLFV